MLVRGTGMDVQSVLDMSRNYYVEFLVSTQIRTVPERTVDVLHHFFLFSLLDFFFWREEREKRERRGEKRERCARGHSHDKLVCH